MDYNQINGNTEESSQNSGSPAHLIEKILIGGNDDKDNCDSENHSIFSELSVLQINNENYVWKETARWIKYEENVEEGGNRWSKPHVSTISLHSLLELRNCLLNGVVVLNSRSNSLEQIVEEFVKALLLKGDITLEEGHKVKEIILQKHHHQYQKNDNRAKALMRSFADMRNNSTNSLFRSNTKLNSSSAENKTLTRISSASVLSPDNQISGQMSQLSSRVNSCTDLGLKFNEAFMKKIPLGTQTNNILVAEIDFLDTAISGFIRLSTACLMGNMTEVEIPTKFLFIYMGPHRYTGKYYQVGRAFATLMSDQVFNLVALKAQNREMLLAGLDEYLDAVIVLPPGVWDPNIRIEPPEHTPTQESRKLQSHHSIEPEIHKDLESLCDDEEIEREKNGLIRTGKLFGGLVNDVKRKAPYYWSDFSDALSLQSLASVAYLYFACLSPIITFGGLLGDATGNNIATMESLMSGAICGIVYGFFSGQPLTILGSTGPVLVFESILYDFCSTNGLNYLSLRLWIGLWAAFILLIMVAFDASVFVCYITRFTEENFATLIAVIFIYKAIEKLFEIESVYPINTNPNYDLNYNCWCNYSSNRNDSILLQATKPNSSALNYCLSNNGTLSGDGCETPAYKSDVFLLSVILLSATYVLSVTLKEFRTKSFFPTTYRQIISDFAVPIAIVSVTVFDNWIGLETPKLLVPNDFKPTSPNRGWFISPFVEENPMWLSFAAVIPAILATILCFMDQQITAVIVNRKENKLKKGCGYHLDLFVLSILIVICSFFGLPWFVAATVLSMTHVNSLKMVSQSAAPGDKPQFLGVREQRVTQIIIFVLCGLSIFFTQVLQRIPMPVLFGVFLYMGTSSLKGSQFFERILILFMPQKYQPDYIFLRQVRTTRVHLFTSIQLFCFAMLWIIKSYKPTSIAFPLMLLVMLLIRKLLEYVFTREELKILDDIMPESTKRKRHEEKEKMNKKKQELTEAKLKEQLRIERIRKQSGNLEIPLPNGNILKIESKQKGKQQSDEQINITEQLSKSSVWKSINGQNFCNGSKVKGDKNDAQNEEENICLNQLNINTNMDKDNDCGITIKIN